MRISTSHIHSALLVVILIVLVAELVIELRPASRGVDLDLEAPLDAVQEQGAPKSYENALMSGDYQRVVSENSSLRAENWRLQREIAKLRASQLPTLELSVTPRSQGERYAGYLEAVKGLEQAMEERADLQGFDDLFNDEQILSIFDSMLIDHGIELFRGEVLFEWEFSPSEKTEWAVGVLSEATTIDEPRIQRFSKILNEAYEDVEPWGTSEKKIEEVADRVKEELSLILSESELEEYQRIIDRDSGLPSPSNRSSIFSH